MKHLGRARAALARLRVAQQLGIAFSILLGLTAALGVVALAGLERVNAGNLELAQHYLPGAGELAHARAAVLEARDFEVRHSRSGDRSYHAEYEEKMTEAAKVVAASIGSYADRAGATQRSGELVAALRKSWDGYFQAQQRVIGLGRDRKQQDAADISDGVASMALDETLSALEALTAYNFEAASAAGADGAAVYAQARLGIVALLAVAVAIGVLLAVAITRGLLAQLGGEPRAAVEVARAVAGGRLATQILVRRGADASVMANLHDMQAALARVVQAVRGNADRVATASAEIAQGNQELSTRTEQQASSLQETAASMQQLGSTVARNADSAREASALAQQASGVAQRGGEQVSQVVQTMRQINDSSKRIADIIGVIDGIAFQTNILALNAAVEAARAGEQGRGFAVVAGEVRSLAQRSADAAKEIKTLIGTSVERVAHGTTLVDQAGATMGEVVAAIQRVSDRVGTISSASGEQAGGVAQVGRAVAQMDEVTQRNAALVEESAAAAESLRQQAQELVQAVAVFDLGVAANAAANPRRQDEVLAG